MRYILKKISKKYIVYLSVLILIIIILRLFPVYDTGIINLNEKFLKMSGKHILGTDFLGRDIYSLLLKGGMRTLEVIVIASSFSFVTGIFAGMITGYTDSPLNVIPDFLIDLFMIIPTFILALVITSQFGLTPLNAGLSIGIGSIGGYYNQTKKLVQEKGICCRFKNARCRKRQNNFQAYFAEYNKASIYFLGKQYERDFIAICITYFYRTRIGYK